MLVERPVAEEAVTPAEGDEAVATGRGVGFTVGAEGTEEGVECGAAAAELRASFPVSGCFTSSLIRSTVDGSRLARALTLTSSPHFWIRSSNSWLLSPSSFANS